MDDVLALQRILESEKTLDVMLTHCVYRQWLTEKAKRKRGSLAEKILEDKSLFIKIYLELEYGVLTKDSEAGIDLHHKVVNINNMKSNNFNPAIKQLQKSYTEFKNNKLNEIMAIANYRNTHSCT